MIDLHAHIWDSLEQLGPLSAERVRAMPVDPWDRPDASPTTLDRATQGVDYTVLLGLVCHATGTNISAEQIAKAVRRRPDRYLGFAGVDPSRDGAAEAVDHAASLGLVGIVVAPAAQQIAPTDARVMKLFERCERRGLPVTVHADTHLAPSRMQYAQPWMLDEVAHAFPKLTLIVSQVGDPWVDQTLTLLAKHPRLFADLSAVARQPWPLYQVLVSAYHRGVTEKLLLGSDFPFGTLEEAARNVYAAHTLIRGTTLPDVPREVLRAIVQRDSLAALGIAKPQASSSADGEVELDDAATAAKGVIE